MAQRLFRDRVRRLGLALRALTRPGQIERELDEELRFHLEHNPYDRGRIEATKEAYRQAGDLYAVQALARDLRYGARLLRRNPLFTLVAVATLGLGIGLNVTLFSVVNAVLLAPLPYAQPGRLVALGSSSVREGATGNNVGWMTVEDWKRQSHSFAFIASYYPWSPTLSQPSPGGITAMAVIGEHVSANFFPTLGIVPMLGHNFTVGEDRSQHNHEVLLSYAFWRSRFGSDPSVVGRAAVFNRVPYLIVGVMPASLDTEPFRPGVQAWTPIGYDASVPDACRSCQHLQAIGRLAPGVSLARARQEMNAIQQRLAATYPDDFPSDARIWMVPLRERVVGGVSTMLWMLLMAAGLVLLVVCANLTNLLLARAAQRRAEMAVRAALGAARGRLVRQVLTEGLVLGTIGGGVGIALTLAAVRALGPWAAAELPRLQHLNLDLRARAFGLAISLGAGTLASLAPALQAARAGQADALRGARVSIGGGRPRHWLVGLEVALTLVLAVGTGLILKSFMRVLSVPPGFDPHQVYTTDFVLAGPGYATDAAVNRFSQQLLDRLSAQPRIQAVGLVSVLPMDPGNFDRRAFLTLDPPITTEAAVLKNDSFYDTYFVSPGYFAAMGIPLRRGRLFTEDDINHADNAVIVDESLAHKLWPGREAIGQAMAMPLATGAVKHWSRVVGVVADVHQYGLDQAATSQVYAPYPLNSDAANTVVVRSALPPAPVAALVRNAVAGLDAAVPLENGRTMNEMLHNAVAQRRITLELLGVFGALALGLAALGIYGVVAYATTQRRSEIGLRMALGARAGDIRKLVVAGGMRPVLGGLGMGAAAALAAGRLLSGLLYEVKPNDPPTFAVALAVLAAVAFVACWLPAWRASRLDPARALRLE